MNECLILVYDWTLIESNRFDRRLFRIVFSLDSIRMIDLFLSNIIVEADCHVQDIEENNFARDKL